MHTVVLGGGPAGAAAAITLRNAGLPVTVIERDVFPRYRPGETLHPGIEPLLEKLRVSGNLYTGEYLRLAGIWADWAGQRRFSPYGGDNRGPWLGFQAPRADFDHKMLASACDLGAVKIVAKINRISSGIGNNRKRIQTTAGDILADYLIDCTGQSQFLIRHLKIPVIRYSPALVARFGYVCGKFDGLTPSIWTDKTGWTWIAEVEPDRFQWTRVTESSNRPSSKWIPVPLRGLLSGSTYGADVTWRIAEKVAGKGWFLAGDAAAVLDPSSSHGVLRAIMTGMMAAHLIMQQSLEALSGQASAHLYHDWLSSGFRHDVAEMTQYYRSAGLFGFH